MTSLPPRAADPRRGRLLRSRRSLFLNRRNFALFSFKICGDSEFGENARPQSQYGGRRHGRTASDALSPKSERVLVRRAKVPPTLHFHYSRPSRRPLSNHPPGSSHLFFHALRFRSRALGSDASCNKVGGADKGLRRTVGGGSSVGVFVRERCGVRAQRADRP